MTLVVLGLALLAVLAAVFASRSAAHAWRASSRSLELAQRAEAAHKQAAAAARDAAISQHWLELHQATREKAAAEPMAMVDLTPGAERTHTLIIDAAARRDQAPVDALAVIDQCAWCDADRLGVVADLEDPASDTIRWRGFCGAHRDHRPS